MRTIIIFALLALMVIVAYVSGRLETVDLEEKSALLLASYVGAFVLISFALGFFFRWLIRYLYNRYRDQRCTAHFRSGPKMPTWKGVLENAPEN